MSQSETAIKVENLGKRYHIYDNPQDRLKQALWLHKKQFYREFWALRDVSFEVKRGETLGIIGRNGSGKSTLLQMICGTLTPTSGEVVVRGRVAALLELGSGFNPEFTGRENIYMNASILGLTREEIDSKYDDIVAFADIGDFIEQPVKTYSSGMNLRLAFSVIAHVDADILIIDEALAVGDVFFTQKCMRFLRQFQKTGTILFVSHDTGAVLNLCQRAVWLDGGIPRKQGPAKEVCEDYLAAFQESAMKKLVAESSRNDGLTGQPRQAGPVKTALEVPAFNPNAKSYGARGATIIAVRLEMPDGKSILSAKGAENMVLTIRAYAHKDIETPILGFYVKDRLGQYLFGDNTFVTYQGQRLVARAGETIEARFSFRMPFLPMGDYSIAAAVAEGTQDKHVQHHWIHDALILKSHGEKSHMGLVGIPMDRTELSLNLETKIENEIAA